VGGSQDARNGCEELVFGGFEGGREGPEVAEGEAGAAGDVQGDGL